MTAFLPSLSSGSNLQSCEECHTSPYPSGDFFFSHPSFIINAPTRISPNLNFSLFVDVFGDGDFQIEDVSASLSLSPPNIIEILDGQERYSDTIGEKGGPNSFQWALRSTEILGSVEINLTFQYTVSYSHPSGDPTESYTYSKTVFQTIDVKPTPLEPSLWNLISYSGKENDVEMFVNISDDIDNVTFIASPAISDWVEISSKNLGWTNGFLWIPSGQMRSIQFTFSIPDDILVEGAYIEVIWELDGIQDESRIPVFVTSSPSEDDESAGWFSLSGRFTGILTLILFLIAMVTGGVGKRMKKRSNQLFGSAKTRMSIHCGVSFVILSLSIFHGVILWAGPYYNTIWDAYIVMGMLSTFAMGVVSVNGIFVKKITRRFGRKIWKSIHLYFSMAALIISLVHGFSIGTDIGFL